MNATTPRFTATRTRSGGTVHLALTGSAATFCGSKVAGTIDGDATCGRCQRTADKITANAAVAVPEGAPAVDRAQQAIDDARAYVAAQPELQERAVPAAATREEVTATVTESRYEAVRHQGRPGVLDRTTGKVTQTRTKSIAEEKAAKLNRQHEAETRAASTAQAGEDAVTAVYERAAAKRAAKDEDAARDRAAARAASATVAPVAPKGPSPEVVAKAVKQFQAELTAAAPAITAIMAEPLPGKEPAKAEKPVKLFSVWVGHRIADMLMPLADAEPGTDLGSIGGKLRDAKQGRRLARTIRLTPAEREALAGYATQVENDAVAGKDAPLADSARTLRGRLA